MPLEVSSRRSVKYWQLFLLIAGFPAEGLRQAPCSSREGPAVKPNLTGTRVGNPQHRQTLYSLEPGLDFGIREGANSIDSDPYIHTL